MNKLITGYHMETNVDTYRIVLVELGNGKFGYVFLIG